MSTRDEGVAAVVQALGGEAIIDPIPAGMAVDALIAEGWRKMPSREAIARAIASGLDGWNDYDAASIDYKRELLEGADAVLALMDRGQ